MKLTEEQAAQILPFRQALADAVKSGDKTLPIQLAIQAWLVGCELDTVEKKYGQRAVFRDLYPTLKLYRKKYIKKRGRNAKLN